VVTQVLSAAPSLFASTVLQVPGVVLTLGFAVIWLVLAATLIVSMLVAIHRSIPRAER
jgi:hypothetical protein